MTNFEKAPTFIDSTLKVTAQEDVDMSQELEITNESNLTIEQLLLQNEKKEN